jgi:hypothetical protein
MVTSYLAGGLGNQIFQVVAAYNLAKKNNDISEFNFNECHTPFQGYQSVKYKDTIFKDFNHKNNLFIENIFSQKGHCFETITYKKNLQLQGFFQSEKFFEENKKDIVEKLLNGIKSEKEKYENVIKFISSIEFNYEKSLVSVHIRRGDYLKFPHIHTPCGLDYYKKALFIMKEKIGDFKPVFISDDKDWCKEVFKDLDCLISPFNDEIEDLILMINCKHNIIANSSFSWWGAYLNQNPNKIVIGPKKWFGPGGPQDQQDTIPESWIKI